MNEYPNLISEARMESGNNFHLFLGQGEQGKVQLFWEGHKNLHQSLVYGYDVY